MTPTITASIIYCIMYPAYYNLQKIYINVMARQNLHGWHRSSKWGQKMRCTTLAMKTTICSIKHGGTRLYPQHYFILYPLSTQYNKVLLTWRQETQQATASAGQYGAGNWQEIKFLFLFENFMFTILGKC